MRKEGLVAEAVARVERAYAEAIGEAGAHRARTDQHRAEAERAIAMLGDKVGVAPLPELVREELEKLSSEVRALVPVEVLHEILLRQLPEAKRNIQGMAELLMPKLQEVMAHKFEELIGILCLSRIFFLQ